MNFSQFIAERKIPKNEVGPNAWYALIDAFNEHIDNKIYIEGSNLDMDFLQDYWEDGHNYLDEEAFGNIEELTNKISKLLDNTASVYWVDDEEWYGEPQEGNYIEVESGFDTYRLYHKNINKIAKLHKDLKVTKGK